MITRVLLVLAILLSGVSAYMAKKTQKSGEERIAERETEKGKVKERDGTIQKQREEKAVVDEKLRKSEKEVKDLGETVSAKNEEISRAKQENTRLTEAKKEKEAEVAKLQEDLKKAQETPPPAADTAEKEAKLVELTAEKGKLEVALKEANERADAEAKKVEKIKKENEEKAIKIAEVKKEARKRAAGQVIAYNESWNFVVVSIGDSQGVTPESRLEIRRDGQVIAKLRVIQVQPNQATAGVEMVGPDGAPKKMAVSFLPTDKVVFSTENAPASGVALGGLDPVKVP